MLAAPTARADDLRARILAAYRADQLEEAKALAKEALARAERAGVSRLEVAEPLNFLAAILVKLGDYEGARAAMERALAVRTSALGPDHPDVAQSLHNLGAVYLRQGLAERARRMFIKAIDIRRKRYGFGHTSTIDSMNSLAAALTEMGELVRARPIMDSVLQTMEKVYGAEHIRLAMPLNNYGLLQQRLLDLDGAQRALERSLAIREKHLGPENPMVAVSLDALAMLHNRRGDNAKARPLLERALAITEKALGAGHPTMAMHHANLAALFFETGELDAAQKHGMRALAVSEKALGKGHSTTGKILYNLGELAAYRGDDAAARRLLTRSVKILERGLGRYDLDLARARNELADLLQRAGETERAWAGHIEAFRGVARGRLLLNEGPLPEALKLLHAERSNREADVFLQAAVERAPRDPVARAAIFEALLDRKGAVLAAVMPVPGGATPGIGKLRAELRRVSGELARRYVAARRASGSDDAELAKLSRQRGELEEELAYKSRRYRRERRAQEITLAGLCGALPRGGLLVEYVVLPSHRKRQGQAPAPARLLAVTLRRQACEVMVHDLGDAALAEKWIERYRRTLTESPPAPIERVRALGVRLYRALVAPWEAAARAAQIVLISPDASLAFLPFPALVDGAGRYVLDTLPLVVLDSGRDLLRLAEAAPLGKGALVYGDPDFDLASPAPAAAVVARRGGTAGCTELYRQRFARLGGAAAEVGKLGELFAAAGVPATVRAGGEAREDRLKAEVSGKRYIALATHGYLAPPACGAEGMALHSPLLTSGVVLAGANVPAAGGEDGWLTAGEIAGLDLGGAELVTLSACETALGTVQAGEGVLGLRRALLQAGARSVVLSLWPVADRETGELMAAFYRRVLACAKGGGCAKWQALRDAQRELRDRLERTSPHRGHPFFWAPFVYVGEWER
jgi:CHAT domain-containing protein/Tfp pilus assembly protein PilF